VWTRFLFRYAQGKSGFNLFLEILSTKYPVRLGGLPDSFNRVPKTRFVDGLFCSQHEFEMSVRPGLRSSRLLKNSIYDAR
jgi:hypothetical protein